MGYLDHLRVPECLTGCSMSNPLKEKHMPKQTVNIRVKMCCDGCVRKVRNAVEDMEGVESFDVNQKQQRLTVTGYVDPKEVLQEVKNTGKAADFWNLVPYNSMAYPYVSQAYDKKAPTGFVRNVPQAVGDPKSPEMKMMVLFNDENPNACSIM